MTDPDSSLAPPPVELPGLDGSNPLAFLASIGLLTVLHRRHHLGNGPRPLLDWIESGTWLPRVHGAEGVEDLVAAVIDDLSTWADEPALGLAYDPSGSRLIAPGTDGEPHVRDLKPKPAVMREFLERIAARAEEPGLGAEDRARLRRSMDAAAAFGSELVQDNNGNTKPTAFHFTAGQQKFLEMVRQLREGVGEDDVREALLGPWRGASKLPSLSWDSTVSRQYALRATDPSGERRGSVPAADWLAFVGITSFLSTPRAGTLRTTGFRGRWKDASFAWPIWSVPASLDMVRSLLATPDLRDVRPESRAARGIHVVLESDVRRSAQGGYGTFCPARVV